MSEPGDQSSITMANTEARINFVDPDGPLLDLADFPESAAKSDPLHSIGMYDDPIEDLAVFFENAICWAYTKILKGPAGTFWLFTQLPVEIRIKIWEACIPSQIHLVAEHVHEGMIDHSIQSLRDAIDDGTEPRLGLDPLDETWDEEPDYSLLGLDDEQLRYLFFGAQPYHNRHCQPTFPTAFRQKLPFIAQINREARDVALSYVRQHIKMCYNLALVYVDMQSELDRIDESPAWVNINTDTVLINFEYQLPEDHPEGATFQTDDGTRYVKTDRLFGLTDRKMVKTAIFVDAVELLDPPTCHRLTSGQRVQVVVGVLEFRNITNEQAGLTDLFGLFGEECMALIPVHNSLLLHKLFDAHSNLGASYREQHLPCSTSWHPLRLPRHPTEFHQYEAQLQDFAQNRMNLTMDSLAMTPWGGPFDNDPLAAVQWEEDVHRGFHRAFEPVFLAHRCQRPVVHQMQVQ